MKTNLRAYVSLIAVLSLMATLSIFAAHAAAVASDDDDEIINVEANLVGAAINGITPRGEAEFVVKANGDRKFEVEVENVNLPNGTVLNILVDGTNIGTLTLFNQAAEREFETED